MPAMTLNEAQIPCGISPPAAVDGGAYGGGVEWGIGMMGGRYKILNSK